jgi:hypothetical protein
MVQAGIDLYKVQRLLGHKSPIMTQRYAHHYSESLREGVDALEAGRLFSTHLHNRRFDLARLLYATETMEPTIRIEWTNCGLRMVTGNDSSRQLLMCLLRLHLPEMNPE